MPWLIFAALASAMLGVSAAIVSSRFFQRDPGVLSGAIAIDLIVIVPILYWCLVVRPGLAPSRTLIPIAALAIVMASAVLPRAHSGFLGWTRALLLPAETGLLVYIAWKVRTLVSRGRLAGDRDVLETAEAVIADGLGNRFIARLIATEFAVLYFAVASWGGRGRQPSAPRGALAFGIVHSWPVIAALGFVLALETAGMHLLIARWSGVAAWVLTALNAYALLWVVGECRATALRPTLIEPDALRIRVGLRCQATIPFRLVERVDGAPWRSAATRPDGWLNFAGPGGPNVILSFREPIRVRRVYGLETSVRGLGLRLDDADRFIRELRSRAGLASA